MRLVKDEVREEKETIQYDDVGGEDCDVGCDVQELGLHCCSMMEGSEDEEVGGVEGNVTMMSRGRIM